MYQLNRSRNAPRGLFHWSCFDVQLVITRPAFLALDHAALKGEVALVAVGNDFFDTTSGASRHMTENGHKRHEHPTFLSPAVATGKTDVSRGKVTPGAKGKSDEGH